GLLRIVVVAAVLGPTQFANLYQATNHLPNLVFELLTGTLFVSLLVPALVRHVNVGDASRLASRVLTLAVAGGAALVALAVLAGGLVVGLLTADVPAGVARTPTGPAWLLLALLLLQVPLYLCVGVATAVQIARGRFALAAGAPTVENVAIIGVLAAYAVVFGTGAPQGQGLAEVVLLGGGTTAAVLAHTAVQWWGARRCGARLVPAWGGWRDPEVRGIVRLAVPSVGYAGLSVGRYFVILVVAAAVPGGVIAFTVAWAFYNLPLALAVRPVSQAALPVLARAHHTGDDATFGETFDRAFGMALFLAAPPALGYALLSGPLATAVAFGEMATPEGRELLRVCLLGLSLGVLGQAAVEFATQAAYARGDARRPLEAVALRAVLAVAGMLVARVLVEGPDLLLAITVSVTLSELLAGALLCWTVRRRVARPAGSLLRMLARTIAASLVMVSVALLPLRVAGSSDSQLGGVLVVLGVGMLAATTYLAAQWLLRSPELAGVAALARRSRPGRGAGLD
ncbi:MAG: hypothetical protein M3519_11405, partial [Actinomycetota bacterium]|nr:hypothetical protein [Actinomycetota bacterium]